MSDRSSLDLHDFSLVKGGPFYGVLIRLRLLKPDSHAVHRMAIFLALLAWLPLLLLSAFQGLALGGPFRIPFLFDFPVSVRFLLVIPLLVVAESVVDSRVGLVVRYLTQSGLVHEKDYPRYHSAVRQVSRMCNSRVAEGSDRRACYSGCCFLEVGIFRRLVDLAISRFSPGNDANTRGLVVCLCEHSDFSIPVVPMALEILSSGVGSSGEFQGLIFSSSRPIRIWQRAWGVWASLKQNSASSFSLYRLFFLPTWEKKFSSGGPCLPDTGQRS